MLYQNLIKIESSVAEPETYRDAAPDPTTNLKFEIEK
jgi:hypothetical protein